MQFETIAIVIFALAILLFLFMRHRVITDLKRDIHDLIEQNEKLCAIAHRQRDEITNLISTAEDERRARQMATLSAIGAQSMSKTPAAPPLAKKQHSAARMPAKQEETPANRWNDPGSAYMPTYMPSPPHESAPAAPASSYHGGGGSFDGGGASGDWGSSSSSSDSSSSSSCSSSSSDSGSSSSSDSGSSCSSD